MVLEKILALDHPDAMKIYIEALLIGYRGQAAEVYIRNADIECPTLSEYLVFASAKTIHVNMLYKLMRLFSSFEMDLSDFTYLLGRLQWRWRIDYDHRSTFHWFFIGLLGQYRNDYGNLFVPEEENEREVFASDLAEGNFTFPLIHAVNTLENREVFEIVKKRPTDIETKRRCIQIMKDIGTKEHCLKVLHEILKELSEESAKLGPNPFMEFALDYLRNKKWTLLAWAYLL
jgi:hypothetical protein